MIYYVLDTCVIIPNYFDPPKPINPFSPTSQEQYSIKKDKRIRDCFAFICSQWLKKEAMLIVPNFVVAEILNYFAYHQFRKLGQNKEQAKDGYKRLKDRFIDQIRYSPHLDFERKSDGEKWFFNYELNRHHILNLDKIFPIEHNTFPLEQDPNIQEGKVSLSPFDMLLISVAIELETLVGRNNVFLASAEKRMCSVCLDSTLPKCYKLDAITNPQTQLPQLTEKEKITIPQPKITMTIGKDVRSNSGNDSLNY